MDVNILDVGNFELRKPRSSRMSQNQFGVMVDFLTLHPELISVTNNKLAEVYTRDELRKRWEELADILNSDKTGSQKPMEKWKKSWQDQKNMIRNKVARLKLPADSSQPKEALSELEEKAWSLITATNPQECWSPPLNENYVSSAAATANIAPQSAEYVVLNINGTRLNVLPSQIPGGSTNEVSVDKSNILKPSGVLTEGAIKLEPPDSLVSETSGITSVVNEVQSNKNISSSNQLSSGKKKSFNRVPLKFNVQTVRTLRRKREENRIARLLQRQNEILECLLGSVTRIEKSLLANNSQRAKRESAVGNISNNIDKIAGCLGSVSKSLKSMSEK